MSSESESKKADSNLDDSNLDDSNLNNSNLNNSNLNNSNLDDLRVVSDSLEMDLFIVDDIELDVSADVPADVLGSRKDVNRHHDVSRNRSKKKNLHPKQQFQSENVQSENIQGKNIQSIQGQDFQKQSSNKPKNPQPKNFQRQNTRQVSQRQVSRRQDARVANSQKPNLTRAKQKVSSPQKIGRASRAGSTTKLQLQQEQQRQEFQNKLRQKHRQEYQKQLKTQSKANSQAEKPQFQFPVTLLMAALVAAGVVLAWLELSFLWCLLGLLYLPFTRRPLLWLAFLLLPFGYIRMALWQEQPNPVVSLADRQMTVTGVFDGDSLQVQSPADLVGVRAVLSPQRTVQTLPKGARLELIGKWQNPAGKRNPGGFDYAAFLQRRNISGQFVIAEVVATERLRGARALRGRLMERSQLAVGLGLGEQKAGLMQAMVLGERGKLDTLQDTFADAGLAHVLALSGLHVGVLLAVLGWLLAPLGRLRYPILILVAVGFAGLVGLSPSIVRATLMATSVLLSLWLGMGRFSPWHSLGLAATLTLLWFPAWLFDLSLQLSYLSVVGILLLAEALLERFSGTNYKDLLAFNKKNTNRPTYQWARQIVGYITASVTVSIAAQALTIPLVLDTFNQLPVVSPLVNVIALPIASMLVPLGFLAGVLGVVALPLARAVNVLLVAPLARILLFIAEHSSGFFQLYWGEIAPIGYVYYGIAMVGVVGMLRGFLRPWRGLLIVAAAILASMVTQPQQHPPEIVFLDVGQGDSVLIRLPNRTEILVDGGGTPFSLFDVGKNVVVPALRALDVDELELVIASHADADHIEGLYTVLDTIPTKQLLVGEDAKGKALYDMLMRVAKYRKIPVRQIRKGEYITFSKARLDFLHPTHDMAAAPNDNSVVFVLSYEGRPKALFLGDAPTTVEAKLRFPDLDIVMAGHHGSKTSTSSALLQATTPEYVVISYGQNTYGHPHRELLQRLEATSATILQTHQQGVIRLPLD